MTSAEPAPFLPLLLGAPRSLKALSGQHPDGWGLAIFEQVSGWQVHKSVACARDDDAFQRVAENSSGTTLVAHIRKMTVGGASLSNTHPFQSGRWVFAHNGTVKDCAYLRARTCRARLSRLEGDTDSELLFAFLLSRLDDAGLSSEPLSDRTDAVIAAATSELRDRSNFGAFTFLLSDGVGCYAHRAGRTLFLLDRQARGERDLGPRVLVASERLTDDEPWQELEDATLVRIDQRPSPRWRRLAA